MDNGIFIALEGLGYFMMSVALLLLLFLQDESLSVLFDGFLLRALSSHRIFYSSFFIEI
jgi:hypothetical protein